MMRPHVVRFTVAAMVGGLLSGVCAQAAILEQVISREDVNFQCARASMAVGRDGMVYLANASGGSSFILRIGRDGTGKIGFSFGTESIAAATANAAGTIASAHGHFAACVMIFDPALKEQAKVRDFLVSDKDGWDAPAEVEAGESGDFYALDQHRFRILRLSPAGKTLQVFAIPQEPAGDVLQNLRVCEKLQLFYVLGNRGGLRCVGFDGKTRWQKNVNLAGQWYLRSRAFDADADGNLYVLAGGSDTVQVFTPDGQPKREVKLAIGARKPPADKAWFYALRVFGGDVVIRGENERELFQCYDLATGALKVAVPSDHERLTVTCGDGVWPAGGQIPFRIVFEPGPRRVEPRWRVWARPLGAPVWAWEELTVRDGQLQVPADAAGVYQWKVTPETQPAQWGMASEYLVQGLAEIRKPNSKGTITIYSPSGRTHAAPGESLRLAAVLRTPPPYGAEVPVRVSLEPVSVLSRLPYIVDLTLKPGGAPVEFTVDMAKSLAASEAGLFLATPTVHDAGYTTVPLWVEFGKPRAGGPPALFTVQYGDYGATWPQPQLWNTPDAMAWQVSRLEKLGINFMVDRLGCWNVAHPLTWPNDAALALRRDWQKRLAADPAGTAPQALDFPPPFLQLLDAYGAHGIAQTAILMGNDAGLPLGTGFDGRKPDQIFDALDKTTAAFLPFPAFRGWSWSSNWWVFEGKGSAAAKSAEEKAHYEAAMKTARDTGAWDPVLERVSGYRLGLAVDAQEKFRQRLKAIPGTERLLTAVAAPYRQVEAYPPVTFSNVDEVDLQAQWEQIIVPYSAAQSVDFYKRAGKKAWAHPEIWNDDGTGGQVLTTLFQMVMRGADGVGFSGKLPPWADIVPDDPRVSHFGTLSVWRAANALLNRHAKLLSELRNDDRVAILVSGRMYKIDDWSGGVMGLHFARQLEAYFSCLTAGHPASYVFVEDLKPGALAQFKALLWVDQRVEPEPELVAAARAAKAAGASVFADGTCRAELLPDAAPLGVAFDKVEKDPSQAGDDAAYWRFAAYAEANREALQKTLDAATPRAAIVDVPGVLVTRRLLGKNPCLWVVNNTMPNLQPGQLWRMNLAATTRVPLIASVKLPADLANTSGWIDVFAGKPATLKNGALQADLRSLPARLFVTVAAVAVEPVDALFGPHLRDVALADGGSLAVFNAMNWDHNLYALDTRTGAVRWRQRAGQYFAFAPQAAGRGVAVQGFDFTSAEGYHLYLAGRDGKLERRFALYGLPKRLPHRFVPGLLCEDRQGLPPIDNFAVPPGGEWVATCGDLGLAVWSRDGKPLWKQDRWQGKREVSALAAPDAKTLLRLDGMNVAALDPATGATTWTLALAQTGHILRTRVAADGRTLAFCATTEGGRLFLVRDGKLLRAFPTAADDVTLAADGAFCAVTDREQLKFYRLDSGLQWIARGDDLLRSPRLSPDGTRLVAASDLGTLYAFDLTGSMVWQRDCGARAVPAWLPDGDLLVGTWMGTVCRLGSDGKEKWRTQLEPAATDMRDQLLAVDATPAVRVTGWGNAESAAAPLTPNLLAQTPVQIQFVPSGGWGGVNRLEFDTKALSDGQTNAPAQPLIPWNFVGFFAETSPINYVKLDTFRTLLRVEAITLVEDPAQPESWLRDAQFEAWDVAKEAWVPVMSLLSNAAVHTHRFPRPVEAARFRIVLPWGCVGNVRLSEIVLHGEKLGCSHPDVAAKRPVAVLFDEQDDIKSSLIHSNNGLSFSFASAFSGGRCLQLRADKDAAPLYSPPFGHTIPNWDFEIVEKPQPGQYRYLEFAWRGLGPATKGVTLGLGGDGGAAAFSAGSATPMPGYVAKTLAPAVPGEWTVQRVDLWEIFHKPVRIQALRLACQGGDVAFDRVVLKAAAE